MMADVVSLKEKAAILKNVAIGKPAPDFTQNDPDGNPVTLSSLYGKVLLVDFWAAWCAPCRMLSPVVEAIAEDYEGKAKVMKLNVDENTITSGKYNIKGIPTLLLFKDGAIQEQIVGNTNKGAISKMLDNHL